MSNIEYWAGKSASETASDSVEKINYYYKQLGTTGKLDLYRRSYELYHQAVMNGAGIRKDGESGEFTTISVNHYRNFLQHLITLTMNQRPSFEPRATNTDVKSQTQTILARGLLDYYMREKHLERYLKQGVELALLYGEGYLITEWNATGGEVYGIDPDTNIEVREGDISYATYGPLDIIRDMWNQSAEHNDWYIIRRYKNKFDLAAKFPEHRDSIITQTYQFNSRNQQLMPGYASQDTDLVPVYTLYHKRTDSMPDGRQLDFLDAEIVLMDQPLPYRVMPVYRVAGSEQVGTPFGYTVMFDLISLQESANALYSTIMTNQETFGVGNVAVAKGSGISVTETAGGLNFIEYDASLGEAGIPRALNLTQTPAEVFNFLNKIESTMETISGVNSVARGDPQASLKSGAALALVQSQAIQFSQGLQHAYTQLLEDVGQSTITILRDYASVPRIAMIVGKSNRGQMREFTGEDLSLINRVQVDQGNPLQRTTAGKVELATMMLQAQLIKTPDQLLQVIETGNLDTLTEGTTAELLSIKRENESLADGEQVPVMITDLHQLHIMEHKCVVADPAARADPMVVQTVTDHIMEHYKFLSDPSIAPLLQAMGQQPLPPAPPAASVPGTPEIGTGAMPQPTMTANDMAQANMPSLPNMPQSPI